MNFLELASKRYSVRSYLDKEVDDGLLMKVLEAGRIAPSACNNQPWAFIVIKDQGTKRRLESVYNREWFLSAPVILCVCCDYEQAWKRGDRKEYAEVDAAIAMDHITLAAADLGLGTCWVGAFNASEARLVLMLPDHIGPVAFTPLGYPSADRTIKKRKQMEEIVHWEFYGGKRQ